MPRRVPIRVAREVGRQQGLSQVILVAWDGKRMHVVTWGDTTEACDQAAQGGDLVKKALGYPERDIGTLPSRVKKMKARIADLEEQLARLGVPEDA